MCQMNDNGNDRGDNGNESGDEEDDNSYDSSNDDDNAISDKKDTFNVWNTSNYGIKKMETW